MSSLNEALLLRELAGKAMAMKQGSGLPAFGGGFWDKIKSGLSKLKPYAIDALKDAVSGFSKGFTSSEGDLGARAIAGGVSALKAGGSTLARGVAKALEGGSISGFTGFGQSVADQAGTISQANMSRTRARPKI